MDHDTDFTGRWAADPKRQFAESILDQAWQVVRPILLAAIMCFLRFPTSPASMLEFERAIFDAKRNLGRLILERILNELEPASHEEMPHDLEWQGGGYRVLRDKTANRHVAALFGTICLVRRGYRYWHRGIPEPTIFPLELKLGLVEGVTPALGDRIGKQMASSGSSQSLVIEWLCTEHGVAMGVKRLRAFTESLSQGMRQVQLQSQVKTILDALQKANESKGNRKPVLSLGRDGITLCEYKHGGCSSQLQQDSSLASSKTSLGVR